MVTVHRYKLTVWHILNTSYVTIYCYRGLPIVRYVACERGILEVVIALLEKGVGINEPTTTEESKAVPLHVAVLHGQAHIVPELIKRGADLNRRDEEKHCTPLIIATILKEEWIVKQLIKARADAKSLSQEGRSALYIAAEKGDTGILRILIQDCGLGVNDPCTIEQQRSTPLHIAALFNHAHAVQLLLQLGADPTVTDSFGKTALDIAEESDSGSALAVLELHLSATADTV